MLKRISRVISLSFLIAVRQVWILMCNLYQLAYQPYLTIRKLIEEKDKSQIFLLALLTISPGLVYVLARVVWDSYRYGGVLTSVGMVFLVMLIVEILIFGYLGYWFWRVVKKNG